MNKPTTNSQQPTSKRERLTDEEAQRFHKMAESEIQSIKLIFDRMEKNVDLSVPGNRSSEKKDPTST